MEQLNHRTLVVMPAKAGIHSHRPVVMDTGLRRYDNQEGCLSQLAPIAYFGFSQ
jgi:hypothetical protein